MKSIIKCSIAVGLIMFLVSACSDSNSPSEPNGNIPDLSGIWIADEIITGNCPDEDYPINQTELFSVEQQGSNITFTIIGDNDGIAATIQSTNVTWQHTETYGTETFVNNFSGTVSADGKTISGSASWTWTNNSSGNSCSGTTSVIARKAEKPSINIQGKWQGTWISDEGQLQGTFEVNLTQETSMLTGTIDIPGAFFSAMNLKGVLSGSEIIFGDIDDEILFSGIMQLSGDSASGDYISEYLDDAGSWQAWKTSDSLDKQIIVLDSISVNSNFDSDITFDGSNVWCLSQSEKIYKISPVLGLIDSIEVPGNYPQGLAFDGSQLLVGDGAWASSKIYRINLDGSSVISAPGSGNITGLTYDGTYLWAADDDYSGPKIYKLTNEGVIVNSFNCPGEILGGLTFDGTNLRLASMTSGNSSIYRISLTGTILNSFAAPSFFPGGLTYDGSNLWYVIDSDSIAKLDDSGNIISKFLIPGDTYDTYHDLASDGTNLWLVTSNMGENSIKKISTTGTLLNTYNWSGDGASGIAFDGSNLRLADYITEKIYLLNPGYDTSIDFPNSNNINFLTTDGTTLWSMDISVNVITQFDYNGNSSATFTTSITEPKGLVYDGTNLWIANGFTTFEKLTQLDISGNVIAEYASILNLPGPIALTYDGTNFWYIGKNFWSNKTKLYKLGLQ